MKSTKNLGLKEFIAIAVGDMVGGGTFTILGISVSMVGSLAPFAIALGGLVAWFAAYSYVIIIEMKEQLILFLNELILFIISLVLMYFSKTDLNTFSSMIKIRNYFYN